MSGQPLTVWQAAICSLALWGMKWLCDVLGYTLLSHLFTGIIVFIIAVTVLRRIRRLGLLFEFARMMNPANTFGDGFIAGEKEVIEYRLGGPIDGSGIFLGAIGNTIITYKGISHVTTIAPNNSGKSESVALNNCISITHNLVVTDKGGELCIRSFNHRKYRLCQECIVINPWRLWPELDLPNHHFNPLGHLVKMAEYGSPELLDEVRAIAEVLIPDADGRGENKFFADAAKDLLNALKIHFAYWEAETGELVCNLPHIFDVIAGSKEDVDQVFRDMRMSEAGHGAVRKAAGRFQAKLARNPKTFESILSEAQNAVSLFDPMGMAGRSMELSDFDPADLKRKKMTIYIVMPSDKAHVYGKWAGLVADILIRTVMRAQSLHPRVTFELDEFSNLSSGPLPAVIPALYTGRSLGCQLHVYVQDRNAFKRYGDEASAFETQAEILQIWGIRNIDDAKWVEDRAGQTTLRKESVSAPASLDDIAANERHSLSLDDVSVPVVRKDQALQLRDWRQFTFFKNKPVIVSDLVSVYQTHPWREFVTRLPGEKEEDMLPVRFRVFENGSYRHV